MKTQQIYQNKANHQVCIVENQKFNVAPAAIMPYGNGWQYNCDITSEEIRYPNGEIKTIYYATSYRISKKASLNETINAFIRCFYNVDDEFAIQRQRDTKPEKFAKYNETVTKILEISNILYEQFQKK